MHGMGNFKFPLPLVLFLHSLPYAALSPSSSADNITVAITEGYRQRIENDRLIT
jgi:hypothetical protein